MQAKSATGSLASVPPPWGNRAPTGRQHHRVGQLSLGVINEDGARRLVVAFKFSDCSPRPVILTNPGDPPGRLRLALLPVHVFAQKALGYSPLRLSGQRELGSRHGSAISIAGTLPFP